MADQLSPLWLQEHRADRYSQTGEDGVLAKALEMLPGRDGWCVEFGAADGKAFSNTRALIEGGYSAVLIESERQKFAALAKMYAGNDKVTTLWRYVGWAEHDGLDAILGGRQVPADFDLLIIDIDGNDYHAWRAIERYRPKLVLVEFNPTIPSHVRFVQAADPTVCQGNSLLSLTELGREKGYALISVFPWNALFVRADYFPAFGITDNRPNVLRSHLGCLTWLFIAYDGSVYMTGNTVVPWHPGLRLNPDRMQVLPRWLRRPFDSYSRVQRWGYRLLMALRRARWK